VSGWKTFSIVANAEKSLVSGAFPGYEWIMTIDSLADGSDEFFVEWQIAPESSTFIDLSVGPGEAPEMALADDDEARTTAGA
jgi:hypothetical protein